MPRISIKDLMSAYQKLNEEFEKKVKEDEPYYNLKDTILKDSQAVQIQLMMRWQNIHRRIQEYYNLAKAALDEAYAEAYEHIKKTSRIDYSSTEIKMIVEADKNVIEYRHVTNRLYVLKEKAADMVKLTEQRHWVIKELVTTMVNDGELWVV